jgi:hypothetical protein
VASFEALPTSPASLLAETVKYHVPLASPVIFVLQDRTGPQLVTVPVSVHVIWERLTFC